MKILILRSNPVNPDSRVEKETAALKRKGYDVRIFCWDRSKDGKNYTETLKIQGYDIPIERCCIKSEFGGSPVKMLLPLIKFQFKTAGYILRNIKNYDVVHACDFDTALTGVTVSKMFGKKAVYDIFDYYVDAFGVPEFLKKPIAFLDHMVMKISNRVIVCTEKRIRQIPALKSGKVMVVQNSPDLSVIETVTAEKTPEENYKMKIAYFGILQDGRLIKELVDCVSERKEYCLEIGGFGLLEDYIMEAADKNENIHFHGKVNYIDVLKKEMDCDVLTAIYDPVIPNHRYAAPNKFYEAMALGKPLIVCKETYVDEIVEKLSCGETIDCNKASLAAALDSLADRKSDWPEMNRRMKEYYRKELTWEASAKILTDAYRLL